MSTLPMVTTAPPGVMVAPLALPVHLVASTSAGQPVFLLNEVLPVGGCGLGSGGVVNVTACGSCTKPRCGALPAVAAVTLLAVQAPTPERGVERVPQIVVGLPTSARLPFDPTSPPHSSGSGATPGMTVVES